MNKPPSPDDTGSHAGFLDQLASEIIRWNQGINLVSRQGTPELLQDLFRQCVGGFTALWEYLVDRGWTEPNSNSPVMYFDLGSGAGLPGAIWHNQLQSCSKNPQTCLVEPRQKRAWFLDRISSLGAGPPFSVFNGRWEKAHSIFEAGDQPPLVVVSLKALHLTDPEVLDGLVSAICSTGEYKAVIARFYPAGQKLDDKLISSLKICPENSKVAVDQATWTSCGSKIVAWRGDESPKEGLQENDHKTSISREACLVLSCYCLSPA